MNTMRKLIIPLVLFALVLGSCEDELTSLNNNPKDPSNVPGETLFSNAQVSLGTYLNSPDINSNIFKLISQYWASTTYATESQYELTTRAIPSNLWEELYTDVLKDLDEAERLIQENQFIEESVKQNQLATIEVLKVMTYYELMTIFGDIPYSEALDPENTQPAYEDDQAVFQDLMSRLNTAIGNFNPAAESFGSSDVFYNGDVAQWVKFANSLKMRMGITIADVNPTAAQTAIEEASPNAFDGNADNAIIPFQSAPPHTNPLWEALVQSGRNDYVPANTLVDTMNAMDDPRRPIHFTQIEGEYVGGIYGTTNEYEDFSHFGSVIKQPAFEGMILEYAEVEFIRAEANLRGWLTGTPAQAQIHYENAVRADMDYWGVSSSEADDYLAQVGGPAAFPITGTMEEQMNAVATQKWLGLYLQGLQGWTEWRRLDYPVLNVPPEPQGLTYQDIPSRFTYPVDEQNLNQSNYDAASQAIGGDLLTTQLFWDENPPSN